MKQISDLMPLATLEDLRGFCLDYARRDKKFGKELTKFLNERFIDDEDSAADFIARLEDAFGEEKNIGDRWHSRGSCLRPRPLPYRFVVDTLCASWVCRTSGHSRALYLDSHQAHTQTRLGDSLRNHHASTHALVATVPYGSMAASGNARKVRPNSSLAFQDKHRRILK